MAEKRPAIEVLKGIGLVLGLHAAVVVIAFAVASTDRSGLGFSLLFLFAAFGITQLLWVIPATIWVGNHGSSDMLKGVWIAAGLTLLLNGACFAFFMM